MGRTAAGDNDVANGRYFRLDQGLHPHLVYGLGLTRKTWMEHRFSG